MKYQSKKLHDPKLSLDANMEVARLGVLKDLPGAMLAVKIRRLAQERAALETMPAATRAKRSKEWKTSARTREASDYLLREAGAGDAQFFKDFAEGIAFCNSHGTFGPADPIALACLQYAFLTHGKGSLTHLIEWLGERFDEEESTVNVPEMPELSRLCKRLGLTFTPDKRGRKPRK